MTLPEHAVCLYAQGAQSHPYLERGIPRFVVEHLRALHENWPEALHSVLLSAALPLTNLAWLLGSGMLEWCGGGGERRQPPPRVYHVMSPIEIETPLAEMWPRWARDPRVSTVVTLLDLIPLRFADEYLGDPALRARYEARLEFVRCADHVLAISESTADDGVELLGIDPARITVIHAGATSKFATMYQSREAAWRALAGQLPAVRPGFMLYVGGFDFRKNLRTLILAYALLPAPVRAAHQLVIACRMLPEWSTLLREWAAEAGIGEGQLVLTGYVTDEELGALYHACTLFVFPSLCEGSGLPILEAMSCGAAVAASSTPISAELLGDREGMFDPLDPASIAERLRSLVDAPQSLERLAQRSLRRARVGTYTWRNVAELSLVGYERALSGQSRRRTRRARLALVTPWPPEQSGIADYNLRLARELGRSVDVDIVVRGPITEYPEPIQQGVRLISSESYPAAGWLRQHDRIVYCMGNSRFHGHVFELLRESPGIVVLHDVQLTGFFGWYAGRERPEDPAGRLVERVEEHYGARVSLAELRQAPLTWEKRTALGIFMTGEIQRYAERLFVHSRFAQDVLKLDGGTIDPAVPVSVMPFGMPPARDNGVRPTPTQSPLVVSMGVVSEVKGIAVLIAAFALFASNHPAARLIIAGPGEPDELRHWTTFARREAPHANIEIPGHVGAERYEELLRSADVAVQLRSVSNGEASAAIGDCLAAGVPTIVTDVGWASELPRDAVVHLPLKIEPRLLAKHLEELIVETPRRLALSEGALAHARECTFERVAAEYLRALGLA